MTKKTSYQPEELLTALHLLTPCLTPDQQTELLAHCSIIEVKRNTFIYEVGEASFNLFCLLSGVAKIYMEGDGKQRQIVRMVRVGDMFGYRTAFSARSYTTSCVAVDDVVACVIPIDCIVNDMKESLAVTRLFLKLMSVDLMDSDARYVRLVQKHLRGRLAETLLYLAEYFGMKGDGQTISVALSREDLANLSLMTTANAIRTLSAFASEGLVELKQREIKLLDTDRIRFVSEHS